MYRSLAGYYMPDINGSSNTSLPAITASCMPCEVSQTCRCQNIAGATEQQDSSEFAVVYAEASPRL